MFFEIIVSLCLNFGIAFDTSAFNRVTYGEKVKAIYDKLDINDKELTI